MQFAQYYRDYGPMMDGWNHENNWLGLVFIVLFLLIIAALTYLAFRAIGGHQAASRHRDPLDIARERYANGEISKDELAEIKKELK